MDANPIHAWDNLSKNAKIAVVVGAVGVAAFLYYRSKNATSDTGADSESSYRDSGTTAPDAGYSDGAASSGGYYGGGGSYGGEPPLSTATPTTSALDGTTPETPIVNVAAPDLSDIAAAINSVGSSNADLVDALTTGGGAPKTDHTKHAAPKKASSFKTVTKVNRKTGTVQTVHDRPGTAHDVVVKSRKIGHPVKTRTVKKKAPARKRR